MQRCEERKDDVWFDTLLHLTQQMETKHTVYHLNTDGRQGRNKASISDRRITGRGKEKLLFFSGTLCDCKKIA